MIFENENWKLVVTPRFIRKNKELVKKKCVHCGGTGQGDSDDPAFAPGNCFPTPCRWCFGNGYQEELPDIPPPPPMDEKFLAALKKWYQEYQPETEPQNWIEEKDIRGLTRKDSDAV